MALSKTPWAYEPNGDTPSVDGYVVYDADQGQVGLIDKEDDAVMIVNLINKLMGSE